MKRAEQLDNHVEEAIDDEVMFVKERRVKKKTNYREEEEKSDPEVCYN
jgi:hypothetical protein